ncbi:MAG: FAD/NAD(P)-binding oxidoreductase [Proteobacteria bacterium]|nr:FAD/NAD(P)-binding oxidoreductase [Pseudomonadota bacterium]MDA1356152.1 FAD/NAD(P)-binding oxidoreductase [Pseudomonadota bacterium]
MSSTENILIIGAGPAGTRAAEILVRQGLRPIVVDDAPASGGQVYRRQPPGFRRSAKLRYGFEAAKAEALHATFDALRERVDYRPETSVWSIENNVAFTIGPNGVTRIPFAALLLCTGGVDRILPIPGWTLPGAFTLGGAQIALKAQGCAIGTRVAFMGSGPLLYLVAYQYAHAGAKVAAVLDTARLRDALPVIPGLLAGGTTLAKGLWYQNWLRFKGIPLKRGIRPVAVDGEDRVSGLRFHDAKGRERRIDCDAMAFGWGVKPECQLAELAGCDMRFDAAARQWLPECDAEGRSSAEAVYLAGDGAGVMGADAAEYRGELAALALLADRGLAAHAGRREYLKTRLRRLMRFRIALERALPYPAGLAAALADDTIVCRCEGVTAGDIRQSQSLKPDEINRAKAYTRLGMGRCQGRMCGIAAAEILAHRKGVGLAEVGRLRGQAPIKPLHIGIGGAAAEDDPERAASI